jgi:serine protease
VSQTFTTPSNATGLSFWYDNVCHDNPGYDYATATLEDNTAGTTATTILPQTCANPSGWTQVTASLVPNHSYTLTLENFDDGYGTGTRYATYTLFDDVSVQ